MAYEIDIKDVKFQLFDWLDLESILASETFADWDRENIELVLGEALKIAKEQLDPANEPGDREGVTLEDGKVTVPAAYQEPFKTLAEGGWVGCVNNPEYGGLGLPHLVSLAANEFFSGANTSLSLVLLLTRGVGELVEGYGNDELRQLYCEKLYAGTWTGTMCLTEPQAGSDVGASTTTAEPVGDGRYSIVGEKIFITFGDHDMTDNVVHAALARLPGAPAGTKGLSLFLVPKYRVMPDGTLGESNDVVCGGIEHKMGIHGSPTCSMLFGPNGGCEGFLLGKENGGMRLMFEMMNAARLDVGLQGQAIAGAAHQAALAYARERIQSRRWNQMADKDAAPVAIVEHPDVRRLLLTSQAYVEGMRALLLETAKFIDLAHTREGEEAERCQAYVELLTPVCKAWASDWGFRVTEWCLQVFGGYGYIQDYPAEQYMRDAKIASIYEGTNGIQALDLVGRKLMSNGGRTFKELLGRVGSTVKRLQTDPELAGPGLQLAAALKEVSEVATEVPKRPDGPASLMLNAVPFLDMLGHTLAGSFLLEQALLAREKLQVILEEKGVKPGSEAAYKALLDSDQDAVFFHNKIQTAILFAYRGLPNVRMFATAIEAGETSAIDAVF
jgi:alkylation response protein AidB-like acyl-CoA dehydrogenase